jgi:hypothetical protein
MRTIKLPEYRNISICLAFSHRKEFKSHDINLQWTDVPEGTGKCVKCCGGETDIAVILTEGIVKDIVAGNQVKLYRFMCNHP